MRWPTIHKVSRSLSLPFLTKKIIKSCKRVFFAPGSTHSSAVSRFVDGNISL